MPTKGKAQSQHSRAQHPNFAQPRRHIQPVQPPQQARPQRCHQSAQAPMRSNPMHHQRQPHQHDNASMRSQCNGMNSIFVPTCHFCGMIGHLRPNCFDYIKRCRLESMKEKRLKKKANLHEPRELRNMSMTTRIDKVEPRWVRKNEPACHCSNGIPVDATRSNGLGKSIGAHASK